MTKKQDIYSLDGEVYLCDGVYQRVEITRGTAKHCADVKSSMVGGEYRGMSISKLGGDDEKN